MDYVRVTKDNLESEHRCCAIANNKDVQVSSKKSWLAERFDEGLLYSGVDFIPRCAKRFELLCNRPRFQEYWTEVGGVWF